MKDFLGEDWKIERILTGTDKEKEIDILVRYDLSGNRVDSILYEPTGTLDNIQSGRLRINVGETDYDLWTNSHRFFPSPSNPRRKRIEFRWVAGVLTIYPSGRIGVIAKYFTAGSKPSI